MITVILGNKGYRKTIKVITLANLKEQEDKRVLILTKFDIKDEIFSSNVKITESSDENIVDLIANADVIFIDEPNLMSKNLELIFLADLGKQIYYTSQKLEINMPYDEIIEVD